MLDEPADTGDDEVQEPPDTSEEPQTLASDEEAEEAPPEDVSEPAQRRFQKLANRAKEASKENQALKQMLAQQADLISTLKEDTGLRRQQWDIQQNYLQQQQQALQPEQRRRNMLMAGLDPSETFHQFMYDQFEENQRLKAQLHHLAEKHGQVEQERSQDRFSRSVETTIRETVKKYDVDESLLRTMVENAKDIAIARGADPEQAAKLSLERFAPVLKPKLTKRLSPEEKAVHSMIATSGRTGGETPGQARRSNKKPSWEEALSSLGR